jgi:probable O-glycosylation ligase (exosortase A-associated)
MALLVTAGAASVYAIMPQEWFDRMSTIQSYEQDASARARFDSWRFAFDLASSRLMGGGFGAFAGRSDAHSVYFEILGEHGFVGLGLFLALGLFTWAAASRIRRAAEKDPDLVWMGTLTRMTQVSLVAYAAAGAFLGLAYFDYVYNLVLIVIVCTSILAAREVKPQSLAATSPRGTRRVSSARSAAPEQQNPGAA